MGKKFRLDDPGKEITNVKRAYLYDQMQSFDLNKFKPIKKRKAKTIAKIQKRREQLLKRNQEFAASSSSDTFQGSGLTPFKYVFNKLKL